MQCKFNKCMLIVHHYSLGLNALWAVFFLNKVKRNGVGLKSSCPVLKKHTLNFKNTVHGL